MTILSLGRTSRALAAMTRDACSKIIDAEIFRFIRDAYTVRSLLTDTQSLIIGEIPATIVLRNTIITPFENPILTVITPKGEARWWRKLFIERGYSRWSVRGSGEDGEGLTSIEGGTHQSSNESTIDERASATGRDSFDGREGAESNTKLMRRSTKTGVVRRVNIYESATHTALDVARHIHTTADCNIITATSICVPFPNLTMNAQFATPFEYGISPKANVQLMVSNFKRVKMEDRMTRGLFDRKSLILDLRESWAKGAGEPLVVGKFGGRTGRKKLMRRRAAIDD